MTSKTNCGENFFIDIGYNASLVQNHAKSFTKINLTKSVLHSEKGA